MQKAALLFAFLFALVSYSFAHPFPRHVYGDVPVHHWARESIGKLIQSGFIGGHPERFNGEKPINRFSAAKIVAQIMYSFGKKEKFEDVDKRQLVDTIKCVEKNLSTLKLLRRRVDNLAVEIERLKAKAHVESR